MLRRFLPEFFWIMLLPASFVWALTTFLRRRWVKDRFVSKLPTLCVGNIHSGGSGKTPLVLAISEHYEKMPHAIVSRGYRGRFSKMGAAVNLTDDPAHGPCHYGDEAWLVANRSQKSVHVGVNRVRSLEEIENSSQFNFVILDDGFQHLNLRPTISIVVIAAGRNLEDFCLPLNDLREPWSALNEATAVVLVESSTETNLTEAEVARWKNGIDQIRPSLPFFLARRKTEDCLRGRSGTLPIHSDHKLGFFCGIARPERLQHFVAQMANATFLIAFPDHYLYRASDVKKLIELKRKLNLTHLVTTEKDWFKVAGLFESVNESIFCQRINYELDPEFWYFLDSQLEKV
jgi:tetraacyldisaccharide 4'-kinase